MTHHAAALALVAACVLAVCMRQRAWDIVALMALPLTDPPPNTVGHYRCDAKCEKAWTKHVKEVQARLAAEHKKPSAAPTVPLSAVHARTPAVEHHARNPVSRSGLHGSRPAHSVRSGAVHTRPAHAARSGQPHRLNVRGRWVLKGTQGRNALMPTPLSVFQLRPAAGTGTTTADRLKVAEAILKKGSTRRRVSLEHLYTQHSLMGEDVKWGAAHPVGTENKLPPELAHSPRPIFDRRPTQMFWRRLLHTKRHEPWKQGRQLHKKELDAASRRGARVDHTLDYLHVPASREDPVKSELSKLGLVQDQHSFSSLQTPVDHTLDYLHVPSDSGDPVSEGVAQLSRTLLKDHSLDFMRVPSDERKVDIEAVDTIRAYSKLERSRGEGRQR